MELHSKTVRRKHGLMQANMKAQEILNLASNGGPTRPYQTLSSYMSMILINYCTDHGDYIAGTMRPVLQKQIAEDTPPSPSNAAGVGPPDVTSANDGTMRPRCSVAKARQPSRG